MPQRWHFTCVNRVWNSVAACGIRWRLTRNPNMPTRYELAIKVEPTTGAYYNNKAAALMMLQDFAVSDAQSEPHRAAPKRDARSRNWAHLR